MTSFAYILYHIVYPPPFIDTVPLCGNISNRGAGRNVWKLIIVEWGCVMPCYGAGGVEAGIGPGGLRAPCVLCV